VGTWGPFDFLAQGSVTFVLHAQFGLSAAHKKAYIAIYRLHTFLYLHIPHK
jgi:hypothetical protein